MIGGERRGRKCCFSLDFQQNELLDVFEDFRKMNTAAKEVLKTHKSKPPNTPRDG